jgi:crotonobetainyl-CoA:carnitine CoA-transferase CaiB-like acyl-CoA transferase
MVVGPTPVIGEHTNEVLSDILGYDDDKVRALHDSEVVRSTDASDAAAD